MTVFIVENALRLYKSGIMKVCANRSDAIAYLKSQFPEIEEHSAKNEEDSYWQIPGDWHRYTIRQFHVE